MDHFNSAIRFVLVNEGGYSNHKNDKGGATNYGISTRFLKLVNADINNDGHIDQDDAEAMTKERAIELYRVHFWDHYKLNQLFDLTIAAKCLDLFINMRGSNAAKIIQRAVNDRGGLLVAVDGILGKKSFNAINQITSTSGGLSWTMLAIRERQAEFYLDIVENDETQIVFLNGWLARAKR